MNKDENIDSNFDEELMQELSESLSDQICKEMDVANKAEDDIHFNENTSVKNKKHKWVKRTGIIACAILSVFLILFIVVNAFLGKINITDWGDTQKQDEVFEKGDGNGEEVDPDSVLWGPDGSLRQDKNTVNILLVGEEAINGGGSRGRTDSIMIATMNVKQKAIKLTSLMRDMYVQIPDYSDNKLNAAYHIGGMPLLKETIQVNFDIELDGAILVDFNGFEEVIDKLGGVELTISQSEASYLNSTNYISNPANRNVKVGTQILNGNQALGFSRVRYRKASSGEADDFGRTSRQRTVLNAIFEKYKSKNVAELVLLLNDILPLVTTDIQKSDIVGFIGTFVTLGSTKLETLRLPVDNGYTSANIRSMDVLLPNMPVNIEALHTFIFGSTNVSSSTPDFEEDVSNVSQDISKLELNIANP